MKMLLALLAKDPFFQLAKRERKAGRILYDNDEKFDARFPCSCTISTMGNVSIVCTSESLLAAPFSRGFLAEAKSAAHKEGDAETIPEIFWQIILSPENAATFFPADALETLKGKL